METITLQNYGSSLIIRNLAPDVVSQQSVDGSKNKTYSLGEEKKSAILGAIQVEIVQPEKRACILVAKGFTVGVNDHSVFLTDSKLFVVVGPYVALVNLPLLDLEWHVKVDPSACFGIYYSQKHHSLITHGEQEISRISFDGRLQWTYTGKDIFTTADAKKSGDGFTLSDDWVEVLDWETNKYRILIADGNGKIV